MVLVLTTAYSNQLIVTHSQCFFITFYLLSIFWNPWRKKSPQKFSRPSGAIFHRKLAVWRQFPFMKRYFSAPQVIFWYFSLAIWIPLHFSRFVCNFGKCSEIFSKTYISKISKTEKFWKFPQNFGKKKHWSRVPVFGQHFWAFGEFFSFLIKKVDLPW